MAYASTTRVVLYAGFNPMAMLSCLFGIPLLRRHHSGLGLHGGWVGSSRGWWPPFCPGSPWHGFVPPWVRCHPYAGYASMMPAPTASPALLRLRAFSAPSPSEMGILGHTAHNQLLYSLLFGLSTSGVFPVAIASAAGVSIFLRIGYALTAFYAMIALCAQS